MIEFLFYLSSFLSTMAITCVMFGVAHPHIVKEDPLIKWGAIISCFGMLGQVLRNIQFLVSGISPTDSELLFWMLKDLGLCMMIYGYALRAKMG